MMWYPNSEDFDDVLDAHDEDRVMSIINGRLTTAEGQLCEGCKHLHWKAGAMFMDEAYCKKFNKYVGDDWSAETAPRPLEIDCYDLTGAQEG